MEFEVEHRLAFNARFPNALQGNTTYSIVGWETLANLLRLDKKKVYNIVK
jgi:hypothetical protein